MYAPVRTVVWEDGGANNPASYPMCARHGVLRLALFQLLWWQLNDSEVKVLYRPGKGNG